MITFSLWVLVGFESPALIRLATLLEAGLRPDHAHAEVYRTEFISYLTCSNVGILI